MKLSWQYVAGFFDGEGHVRLRSSVRSKTSRLGGAGTPYVSIAQKRTAVLFLIRDFLLEHDIHSTMDMGGHDYAYRNTKTVAKLQILRERDAVLFLRHVLPYLIVKKVEAEDVLRHNKLYPCMKPGTKAFLTSRSPLLGKRPRNGEGRFVSVF